MNQFNVVTLASVVIIGLSACSSRPESDPAYVSPTQYQSYNCNQISLEMQRVSAKIEQSGRSDMTGKVLDTAVAAFAISQGSGVYFDDEDNSGTKRLHNQYDVLEQTAIQKECGKK